MLHLLVILAAVFSFASMSWAQTAPFVLNIGEAKNHWSGKLSLINELPASQILQIETQGDGAPSFVGWKLSSPLDLNAKFIETWAELHTFDSWFAIELRVSDKADFSSYFGYPITRYQDPTFNWLQTGSWQKLSFSLGEAQSINNPDATKIQYIALYVQDKSAGPLVLSISDVKILAAKAPAVISLTFDDGDHSQRLAADIMHRYGLRGTAYLMPRQVGLARQLNRADLEKMQNSYGWSLSSHHYSALTDMSPAYLENEMLFGLDFLNELGSYGEALHFAYPLGKTNTAWVTPQIRQLFRSARRAGGGAETLPPADWHLLRTVNITPDVTPEILKARIEKAKQQKEWLILMFHKIVEGEPADDLEYNSRQFEKLMEVVNRSEVRVLPVDEVWQSFQVD